MTLTDADQQTIELALEECMKLKAQTVECSCPDALLEPAPPPPDGVRVPLWVVAVSSAVAFSAGVMLTVTLAKK